MTLQAPSSSTGAVLLLLAGLACGVCAACGGGGPEPPDTINLGAASGSSAATVLLDGRRASCVDDELKTGSGTLSVDNVMTPGTCSSEVAVFAEGHSMQLLAPVSSWTDSGGDVVNVAMNGLAKVPLAVWIMFPGPTREAEVALEVNRAAELFDTQRCGAEFNATVTDVSQSTFDIELLDTTCTRSADLKKVGFQSGKVNVYYLRTVDGNQGQRCEDGSSDLLLVGAMINDGETLAHELGHALSLGHWNDTQPATGSNLMLSPASGRNSLTLGQCFRTNVNAGSLLNRSGIRTGPTRSCPDGSQNSSCPSLALQ